ncbi:pas fold [Lucifera butyrica]|uniref:Pas fold n=1 Tax=Lucifera butyrica TaxID=1351585 RepID=A0A498RET0_9FIRM|nr:sigma-54-dependent Fis family transcriptional regulator [Lucifera butyrica]VBB07688.1 pas fold [Lucifera butyrica]
MDASVLVVAPFGDLKKVAQEVVNERFADSNRIKIAEGDLHAGTVLAGQAAAEGVEVIVSRGGTASLIAEQVDIPIVNIQVTVLDVLRALHQTGNYPEKVGIAGFKNVIYGCEDLESLWGISFQEIALENEKEAPAKIAAAAREGIQMIVGDAISVKLAPRFGMQGVLIQSGKEAVYKAIKEAQMVAQVRRKEQERSELLRTIIDTSTDGIIATDVDSNITIFNPMAETIFRVSSLNAIGRPIQEVIPQFQLSATDIGDIQRVGNKTVAVKSVPIKVRGEVAGIVATLQNVSQLQQFEQTVRKKLFAKGLVARIKIIDMAGSSPALQAVKRKAAQYAVTQSTVLITGESGTGKEMLAQSIHNLSKRKNGPFVAVNCAALPESLLESELFGYEEGAFTGAKKGGKQGLFELAHGGTVFLDEIGEMTLPLQSRLLRVLQEKEVMRLGGDSMIPVDVRIIAATNQNLPELMEQKKFRQDLYYRLDILRIHMPPLRARLEDIPDLARQMMQKMEQINPRITGIGPDAVPFLQSCDWPGNIRQFANTLERAMLLSEGPVITEKDLRESFGEGKQQWGGYDFPAEDGSDNLAAVEQKTLARVLAEEENNYSRAAARLGIHRTTLWRKLNCRERRKE